MVSKLRRLIADHADLHNNDLPPNYFFSAADNQSSDDLTQLVVMLAGPHGTPYSAGLWRLQLRMPDDYPASPPKAAFRTRIWHPNVEESTGAVCVDTLKRDWESKLTLRDILVTISCLLIHPNPDSALNPMAGSLLQDDYSEFARQARLMTSIHAPVPFVMKEAALQAKRRGEDPEMAARMENEQQPEESRQEARTASLVMKENSMSSLERSAQISNAETSMDYADDLDDDDCKENDPSLSPETVAATIPPYSKRTGLGKRPLSVIPTTPILDTDILMLDSASDDENTAYDGMTASERNIAANSSNSSTPSSSSSSHNSFLYSSEQNARHLNSSSYAIYEDNEDTGRENISQTAANRRHSSTVGKENVATNALFSTSKGLSIYLSSPEAAAAASTSDRSSQEQTSLFNTGVFMKPNKPSLSPSSSSSSVNSATKPFSPMKVTKPSPTSHSNSLRKAAMAKKGKPRTGLRRL